MENLEEWSSVISNVEKKKEVKTKHKENIFQEEIFRRRMQEELKIQEMRLQMKSKEYEKRDKIVKEERVNVKLLITKFDIFRLVPFLELI